MSSDPISRLKDQIGAAYELPPAEPFAPSDDPLARLRRTIADAKAGRLPEEIPPDKPAANTNTTGGGQPPSATTPASASVAPAAAGAVDAIVGQQILNTLEGRPLSGEARAETVRRLALAMQNPSDTNLQAVLDVLITGDPDTGQSR